jgi:hypothetical protein
MYISVYLTGALFVATASSAPSSHVGKTKTTNNYAVSHEGIFTKEDVDNADNLSAPRAQYISEVSADITIPDCTAGLPKDEYSEYTSDGWVGLSAFNSVQSGLIQTGKLSVSLEAARNKTNIYRHHMRCLP